MSATCAGCGSGLGAAMLACPACGRLVHGDALKQLAAEAEAAQGGGDAATALARWREALTLLPAESRQHAIIGERVRTLSQQVATSGARPAARPTAESEAPAWVKRLGPFGGVALLLWKFKFLAIAILSKAKFLLLGLGKASTFLSMLLSMGAYWALYGWKFGVGLVASIYVHEMGHVAALRRFGLPASAPMFIPGFGAVVRMGQHPATVVEDASVGLAGPTWGLGAALFCFALYAAGAGQAWGAIAHAGAWINLFNLLPVWQLDGSRGFAALGRPARLLVAAAFATAWALTGEGLLVLLAIVAAVRGLGRDAPPASDRPTLLRFLMLVAILSFLVAIPVAGRR